MVEAEAVAEAEGEAVAVEAAAAVGAMKMTPQQKNLTGEQPEKRRAAVETPQRKGCFLPWFGPRFVPVWICSLLRHPRTGVLELRYLAPRQNPTHLWCARLLRSVLRTLYLLLTEPCRPV